MPKRILWLRVYLKIRYRKGEKPFFETARDEYKQENMPLVINKGARYTEKQ